MSSTVKFGPSAIIINQGSTIMVTDHLGEIDPDTEAGFFARDTRLISRYRMLVQGKPWLIAGAVKTSYSGARYIMLSPSLDTAQGQIAERQLELRLERSLVDALHEDFDIRNYGIGTVQFRFALELEGDFADLFEVKSHRVKPRGYVDSSWDAEAAKLSISYRNDGFERGVICRFEKMQSAPHFGNGRILFDVTLAPGASWHACCHLIPVIDGVPAQTVQQCRAENLPHQRAHQRWLESTTAIAASNPAAQKAFTQSIHDMGALRLHEHDVSEDLWVPAGGLPWFAALFGRDSLIAGLENMLVSPPLANGALKRLAERQAREREDWRDAQPGKIMHEIRFGELAELGRVPHKPYYGTADATPLFLILLSEAYMWTGDKNLLREHREVALHCLEWIDQYGDLDGDGFQEYRSFSSQGYRNMSWKDSDDAIVYPDGSQVDPPIAVCELQGYVYDAKRRMAAVFDVLGEPDRAKSLHAEAERLKQHFHQAFWMEEEGFFAFALDPGKKPVKSIASNPGHLLWSGIVDSRQRAARVMARLMRPDMFSGWGIRTLSADNPAYDPHSYLRGSVWPHDNGLIAAGAKRYGLWREANRIAGAVLDACAALPGHRLPELIAGVDRDDGGFPVPYIGANAPQAWAAGSVFILLQSILGITPDAPRRTLWLEPTLPEWLPEITLHRLSIGETKVSIRFCGRGAASSFEILENPGDLRICRRGKNQN